MRKSPQFKLKHMKTAIRIISGLPEKDDRCSREEAAEQLAEHFKRAFRKGYTPREVSASLRKEGIIMAEQLIARYQEPDDDAENKRDPAGGGKKDSQKKSGTGQTNKETLSGNQATSFQENQPSRPENIAEPPDDLTAPTRKSTVRHGSFEIRPDTPIGEL